MAERWCYACGRPAASDDGWLIFVRRRLVGRWLTVAICRRCWDVQEPGRAPARVRSALLEDDGG